MYPLLFANRFLTIHTFAVCMIAGFVAVTLWAGYRARAAGLDADACPGLALWVIPASLLGAKSLSIARYLLLYAEGTDSSSASSWTGAVFGGGIIAYGGVIGGIAATLVFTWRKRLDFFRYADAYAPALGVGIFLMRMGCFFAGCCWGHGSDSFLAVSFPPGSHAGVFQFQSGHDGLFPSQLLGALDGLLIACTLLILEKSSRKTGKKLKPGVLFLVFLLLYSLARTVEDLTRFYPRQDVAFHLTYNQWISAGVAACALFFLLRKRAGAFATSTRD